VNSCSRTVGLERIAQLAFTQGRDGAALLKNPPLPGGN